MKLLSLTEGIYWDPKTKWFRIDLSQDSKYRDIVFTDRSRARGTAFSAFSINSRLATPENLHDVKLALKHLDNLPGFEEMLDKAVQNFRSHAHIEDYDIVITPHKPGDQAALANNLVASLEPFLKPECKVLLGGVAKSDLSEIRPVGDDQMRQWMPKHYTDEQAAELAAKIRGNIEAAKRRAIREKRAFKMTDILAQFRKFVSGLVTATPAPGAKVLFVDDILTTGSTLASVADTLQADQVDAFVLLIG